MKRLLVLALLVLGASSRVVHAQPVPVTWRPPICSSPGVALTWSGTAWICGPGAGVTGTGTTNTVAKFTAASVVGNSLLTDDGTTLSYAAGKLTVASATGSTAIAGTLAVTGLVSATSGVTTPANLTTTGGGDIVSGDALTVAGLSTLTGGFTLGADSSAGSHKITSLTNGSSAQDAAAFGQIGTAVNAAVSGTSGTYAVFSGTNAVGNSTFPISESSATALAIGNSTSSDVVTINSRLVSVSTDTTNPALFVTWTPSAGTTSNIASIRATANGTLDTTAATLQSIAVRGFANATRSAGPNNLIDIGVSGETNGSAQDNRGVQGAATGTGAINYAFIGLTSSTGTTNFGVHGEATGAGTTNLGGDFTATNATTNIALRTINGSNYFNTTSGQTCIACTSGSAIAGNLQVNSGGVTSDFTSTTVARTSSLAAFQFITNGTTDTTSGALNAIGVDSNITQTRSAGPNNLTNIAANLSAANAQVNVALRTVNGDVQLNNTSGLATIGFSNATASALTVKGQALFTSTLSTDHANQFTWTPVAGTSTGVGAVRAVSNGTFDTTSGIVANRAIIATNTSTRSAGANLLNNIAIDLNASGGQTNVAIYTQNGDNYINALSGNTAIGTAFGASLTAKLRVDAASNNSAIIVNDAATGQTAAVSVINTQHTGTFDTTAGAIQTNAMTANCGVSRSAGPNNLTCVAGRFTTSGGAQVNVALDTVSGDNYLNDTSGKTGAGYALGAAIPAKLAVTSANFKAFDVVSTWNSDNAALITWTPVASTSTALGALVVTNNGTFDTTAGVLDNRALNVVATATRSAGPNNLTNFGVVATATGAQINIAFRSVDGSNYFNTSSGNTSVGYASGAALPAKISATSTSATSLGDFLLTTSGSTFGLNTVNILDNGTFDTTASARDSRGIKSFVTSTRSAGANVLTNTAVWASATGGQKNISFQTDDGDIILNNVSGTLTSKSTSVTFGTSSTTVTVTDLDTSARPTLTNCGTGAQLVGNDSSWKLTTGTTSGACTVTFNVAKTANASCTVTPRDGVIRAYAVSTTAVSFTVVTDSQVYDGQCRDH